MAIPIISSPIIILLLNFNFLQFIFNNLSNFYKFLTLFSLIFSVFEIYHDMRRQITKDELVLSRGVTTHLFHGTNWDQVQVYHRKRHL